jgi:iron-sulfur cluster insertion protein
MDPLTIEESAANKIKTLLAEENEPNLKLRMYVQGGGCSGFQYGFTFDLETNHDDYVIEQHGVTILVDAMSMQYIQGSIVSYKTSLMSDGFEIKNPNSTSSCGCGSSFSS